MMRGDQFVIIVAVGPRDFVAFGPSPTRRSADEFAAFLNREVDPAVVVPLRSPTDELLSFYKQFAAEVDRNNAVPDLPQSPVEQAEAVSRVSDRVCASRDCYRAKDGDSDYCCRPCAVGDVARALSHHAPHCVKVRAT